MKKVYKILIAVVVIILVVRIILPYVVLHYANNRLAHIDGYYGHIEDVDLGILSGAYAINDVYINKVDSVSGKQNPFFKANRILFSIEWRALFKGKVVGQIILNSPVISYTKEKTVVEVGKDTTSFRDVLHDFMPLRINRLEVNDGLLQYFDKTIDPVVALSLRQLHLLALNLTNVTNDKVLLPSTISAQASLYEGTFSLNMKLNALAEHPTFDMNSEVKSMNLVKLNDFLKAYGKFDVSKGIFYMYSEVAAKDGEFKGYVKPVIKDLDVKGIEDRHDSFLNKVWESVVGATGVILKNQKKKQLATKVPMEGNFNDPNINTIEAVWEVLKNAFIQALLPSIDNEINIQSVGEKKPEKKKSLLEKIISPGKDNSPDKKEKKDKK